MAKNKNKLPPKVYDDMRRRHSAPAENYNLLNSETQSVREKTHAWDTDYVLGRYVNATDKMIGVLDGSVEERTLVDPADPERSKSKPDTVIWLDKSARPVTLFVEGFWDQFASDGEEVPDFEFLNIDRADWFMRQGYRRDEAETRLGPEAFDIDKVPLEDIAAIRAYFTINDLDPETWQETVWDEPTRLDGKNILIVDEVRNKGGTLSIAQQLIKRAIPDATVSGEYFWSTGRYALQGNSDEQQMESAPVWYNAHDAYGRGIGDISRTYHEQLPATPENIKKKLAWFALSAPHHDADFKELPDKKYTQLAQDVAYLTYDVADGKVIRQPSMMRDIDDQVSIIDKQGLDPRTYTAYRAQRESENRK